MINALNSFGIYQESIEDVTEISNSVLDEINATRSEISSFWSMVDEEIKDSCEQGALRETHITNVIIASCFSTIKYMLSEKFPSIEVEYYVNGLDSDLIINGDGYSAGCGIITEIINRMNLFDSVPAEDQEVLRKISESSTENIENFLGYQITADVLENLEYYLAESYFQMSEELFDDIAKDYRED